MNKSLFTTNFKDVVLTVDSLKWVTWAHHVQRYTEYRVKRRSRIVELCNSEGNRWMKKIRLREKKSCKQWKKFIIEFYEMLCGADYRVWRKIYGK